MQKGWTVPILLKILNESQKLSNWLINVYKQDFIKRYNKSLSTYACTLELVRRYLCTPLAQSQLLYPSYTFKHWKIIKGVITPNKPYSVYKEIQALLSLHLLIIHALIVLASLDLSHDLLEHNLQGRRPFETMDFFSEALSYLQHLAAVVADVHICLLALVDQPDYLLRYFIVWGRSKECYRWTLENNKIEINDCKKFIIMRTTHRTRRPSRPHSPERGEMVSAALFNKGVSPSRRIRCVVHFRTTKYFKNKVHIGAWTVI